MTIMWDSRLDLRPPTVGMLEDGFWRGLDQQQQVDAHGRVSRCHGDTELGQRSISNAVRPWRRTDKGWDIIRVWSKSENCGACLWDLNPSLSAWKNLRVFAQTGVWTKFPPPPTSSPHSAKLTTQKARKMTTLAVRAASQCWAGLRTLLILWQNVKISL